MDANHWTIRAEDEVRVMVDMWPKLTQAMVYAYLNRQGMRITDAMTEIDKARRQKEPDEKQQPWRAMAASPYIP